MNGLIVHGKAAIVAIKRSPVIAINEPVFPRVMILCLVNVDLHQGYSHYSAVVSAFVGGGTPDVYSGDPRKMICLYLPTVFYHIRIYEVQPLYHAGRGKFGTFWG